jgi:hypothetical protein
MSHHNTLGRNDTAPVFSDLKIFIKDVYDKHGRKRPLTVKPWATVKDVKDQLCKHLHVTPQCRRIYFGPLLTRAKELPNHRTLQDAGIYRSGETLLLKIRGAEGSGAPSISSLRHQMNDICVSSSLLDLTPKSLQRMVQQARRGLAVGLKPALAPDGSGGSYFLSDARKVRVGVFKPADEEPFAENNPRGYVSPNAEDNLRKGIRPGELCLRECAAFLLDHDGFSTCPMTTLAEARHPALHINGSCWTLAEGGAAVGIHSLKASLTDGSPGGTSPTNELPKKVGSFQEYVHAECTMDDIGFSKISVDEVHKIAILDIRLMNADRNAANILCQRIPEDPDHFRLIPIDHGYSLRSCADVAWFDWCWLDWPQTKEPLSEHSREYVLNLDVEADARMLRERLGFKNDVLDYFRASCHALKSGVKAGLTLYEIASEILCRNDASGEIPSKLENLTTMATELAMSAVHNGRFHHSTASHAIQEQLASAQNFSSSTAQSFSPLKPRPVVRSISSSVFSRAASSIGGESAFTDELSFQTPPPAMAHSSLSDNSSNDGYSTASAPDEYEAEDWAAAVLAVADTSMNADIGRERATSESSTSENSNLSKSPVGFWYVRPGSSRVKNDPSDAEADDFITSWSFSEADNPRASIIDDGVRRPSHIITNTRLSSSRFSSCSGLSKILYEDSGFVGFSVDEGDATSKDADSKTEDRFDQHEFSSWVATTDRPPSTTSSNLHSSIAAIPVPQPQTKTFSRSISYSAISSSSHAGDDHNANKGFAKSIHMRNSSISSQDDESFRTYFLKFVDLLIVRETERLIQCRH